MTLVIAGSAIAVEARADLSCGAGALTCVEIAPGGEGTGWLPATFGQPFRAGDVAAGKTLRARDAQGADLALQIDQRSTYPDGSLRFAVFSVELPKGDSQARRVDLFVADRGATAPTQHIERPLPNLEVALSLYTPQITVVKFGDRKGTVPGTPFKAGENITLVLSGSTTERFTLEVAPAMSGGSLDPYMKIAGAFAELINKQSQTFKARYNTANDGYEKVWITHRDRNETFSVSFEYAGPAKISVLNYLQRTAPERYVAKLSAGAKANTWLDGGVARERDFLLPLVSKVSGKSHPHLLVRAHVRQYAQSGLTRCDVVIENDWAFEPSPSNFSYDADMTLDGAPVAHHDSITHFHHARWHERIWSGGAQEPRISHQIAYFLSSRAVPNYDRSLQISDAVLDAFAKKLKTADTGPMGTALITPYMPTTGGRADIGPLPRWTVLYLLTMDPRARAVMFANADAGGSIPIHYRDKASDLPVSIDAHPTMAFSRLGAIAPADRLPEVTNGDTPWTAQIAHHPSLSYVPYLVTGDLFYLEETMFWANWVLADGDATYRSGAKGFVWHNELRGVAWSLRTLGEAATVLPDGHPMKAYFNEKLQNTLAWYDANLVHGAPGTAVSPLGIVEKIDEHGKAGPWQQDFLFLAVGHLAEMDIANARPFLNWLGKFSVGRWQADEQGYCHQMAPAYYVKIRDESGRFIDTWQQLFAANWPAASSCPATYPFGDPSSGGGYIAGGYAVLGVAADFKLPGAAATAERLAQESPGMMNDFRNDPTFAIVPRGAP